jgi:hypothetical protein
MPFGKTEALTFFGAVGIEYCSAEIAAGAIAKVVATNAKAPNMEILFFIPEWIPFYLFGL